MKKIKVIFAQPNGMNEFSIQFEVFSHKFAKKWLSVLENYNERRLAILSNGVFYGTGLNDREYLLSEMQRCIDIINAYKGPHIFLQPTLNIDQNFLNDLHKEFERLSVELSYQMPSHIDNALIDLNTAIHQYEAFIGKPILSPEEPKGFSFDVNFDTTEKTDLEADDFELFTPDKKWGWLYLNYATVGVPVYYAYLNKESKAPVPQKQYKGDFSVHFDNDQKFTQWKELEAYLTSVLNLDIKDKRLAIGAIPLARYLGRPDDHEKVFAEIKKRRRIQAVEITYHPFQGLIRRVPFLNKLFLNAE